MTDVLTPSQRSFNMSQIRGRNTVPELAVAQLLREQHVIFDRRSSKLPGRPDFVLRRARKVIFVHGCYWHLHRCRFGQVVAKTNPDFWRAKRLGNAERDRRVRRQLKAMGWQVLTIWECRLKRRRDEVARRLAQFCQE